MEIKSNKQESSRVQERERERELVFKYSTTPPPRNALYTLNGINIGELTRNDDLRGELNSNAVGR